MAFEAAPSPSVDLADLNGSVKFSFVSGGTEYTYNVRFGWPALAKLQAVHGDDFLDVAVEAMGGKRINEVCELLSYATGETRESIMNASPPVLPAVEALTLAWQVAWRGSAEQTPLEAEEDEDDARKKRKGLPTLLARLASWLSGRG
jgi:hypothetical protein